ncbi:signal peptide peptidase SppA, 36K type [Anoxybacillus sp. B7M1]|uniref:Signal peptide peptidase SppA n=1 Tax=Anoxybacteroides rupiense TaxID=311460 RepID=A0ABD5IUU5_9BACL|nr:MULTISPECIES: signal peptide peptidase SppA [Anoxybacillus]ANB57675.1 signal peptide peptidase SppA, 36K type [Anoxybacillus sp. B2M1]ANB66051.1 signal peptide peptidase SppA, 36K type [Anoxybacillus sp. B7M1]KXG11622.1 putative signal peptide peptidase SppA [Anoxybacillus sp. P3H1B]MBS2771425.1 signal peptide peptidase SppA [Anoxybacillus rupiensis]MDE8562955.1 signal peptide peptidase SppA [Anoxybacillus rupiensis]
MNRKRWIALAIAVVLFVISSLVSVITSFMTKDVGKWSEEWLALSNQNFEEEVLEEGNTAKKIVVLEVNGVIEEGDTASSLFSSAGYDHRSFLQMIEQAKEDETVKAIVLRVNSPGGGVVESAEIHDQLLKLRKETKKPVYVSMGAMAASGGYYISTAADKIFASPETMTGSLGVIMQNVNYEELAKKYGVEFVTIKSGPYKDIMSPSRKMTEEEQKILQSLINNSYDGFVKVISEGRHLSEDEVRKIADGRIYDGRQAKQLKLIDEFGYLDDTIAAMKRDYHLQGAQVIKYTNNAGLASLFHMLAPAFTSNHVEELELVQLFSKPKSPRLMYLYVE